MDFRIIDILTGRLTRLSGHELQTPKYESV